MIIQLKEFHARQSSGVDRLTLSIQKMNRTLTFSMGDFFTERPEIKVSSNQPTLKLYITLLKEALAGSTWYLQPWSCVPSAGHPATSHSRHGATTSILMQDKHRMRSCYYCQYNSSNAMKIKTVRLQLYGSQGIRESCQE